MMSKSKRSVHVSVVVPTFNRPEMLIRCLAALMAQDYDAQAYEVIIADDAACAETRQVVESWTKGSTRPYPRHTLRYMPVIGNHGPAAARNAGWRAATGEIIAFTDDDCIPTPGWLSAGMAAFTDSVLGVSGRLIVPIERIPTDYERNAAQLANAEFVTANCFYRRSCLEAIGGFDENFTSAWREDSDLIFTLWRRFGDVASDQPCQPGKIAQNTLSSHFVHASDAIVIHPLRPAQWGISLRQQRKSMFNALLYKKHPRLYRQEIQATPPLHYYGMLGSLLAFMLGIFSRHERLAFIAACLWLLLTGRFCLNRLQHTSSHPFHKAEMLVTSALIPPLAIFWRIRGALKFRVFFF
jgi:cellulose synthase/poly-beta-1,6-N-acetylglucosamine synthase-like glycosyltransferase